jgi:hypothetical protein
MSSLRKTHTFSLMTTKSWIIPPSAATLGQVGIRDTELHRVDFRDGVAVLNIGETGLRAPLLFLSVGSVGTRMECTVA